MKPGMLCSRHRTPLMLVMDRTVASATMPEALALAPGLIDQADPNPISISSSRTQNVVGGKYAGFTSPRFGLSPKSVLIAAGKDGHGSGCTAITEAESLRCRRTDGKKWQCRRDTLPNQKYCEAHMHRGAKRPGVNPEYSRSFHATPSRTISRNIDSGINLNTFPASPQNSSSSTSNATTISDLNVSFCLGKLSPNDYRYHGVERR